MIQGLILYDSRVMAPLQVFFLKGQITTKVKHVVLCSSFVN